MARSDGTDDPTGASGEPNGDGEPPGAVESLGVDAVVRLDRCGAVVAASGDGPFGPGVEGDLLAALVVPGDRARAEEAVQRVLGGDSVRERTLRVPAADGSRWVELSAEPIAEDGEVVGARAAVREVTGRENQGDRGGHAPVDRGGRNASTDRRLAAMEAALDGLAVLDADGEYVYLNEAHAALYGYDREELRGRSWRELYWPAERERLAEEVLPTVERAGSWRGEAVGRRRGGSTFRQELSLAALRDGGLVCVVRDVTDRHRREGIVEVLDRVLRHNLRNQLNVVLGEAERIGRLSEGTVAEGAGRVRRTARSLLETSETAREVRRAIAIDDPAGVTDLDAVTRRCCRELDAGCDLSVDRVERALPVPDHGIELAVRELLDNAAEHAGPDPDVSVSLTRLDGESPERCRLRIADDGPGLPTLERDVLTEGDRGPLRHGQGIGLWLVNWVVTEAGGEVSVVDRPVGTAVEVRLPLVEDGADRGGTGE